ncbi:glycosyltransferase [Variovorax sp. J22P240]|uniref:CgeB family protein n=1 Tax=Variovorax sp. J22P240 TaxID=3053514 RepID=UPI002574A812|nr:glycosyltransferase [Variovorax sp. J22P240]MDM0001802.1 glycosyltransferase [Variovorax sp. J22P240]
MNRDLPSKPATLAAFRGAHAGGDVIVCGCGPSLLQLADPGRAVTIGVNDVGRLFNPDYLVVVNPPRQFTADRFSHVRTSKARALFTQLDLGPVSAPVVRVQLGRHAGVDTTGNVLHFTQNSPYVAVCLAAYMGASHVGLIGVDFTDHHFFATTGRHPLSGRVAQIDREYGALAEALRGRGVQLVNLSAISRLESLPRMRLDDFMGREARLPSLRTASSTSAGPAPAARRVFVVNYRFLSCGDVFADGLRHAAAELNLSHADAYWDDPRLPEKIAAFRPDLLLVVHGRRFAQKWGERFRACPSAVWLTDEPYEVDDTASWSSRFDYVFANDPVTLNRHRNAHYLPVCFDPQVHRPDSAARPYRVGFIGGYNATRERFLLRLAEAKLLSYVVGGPWRSPTLRNLCLAGNVPASRCAELYRQTDIVVNVFRETHHFNAQGVPAHSMNPRIYEALACGAAVVSERRAEVGEVFPELPQFDGADQLIAIVEPLLNDATRLADLRQRCIQRLAGHAYRDRLAQVLATSFATAEHPPGAHMNTAHTPVATRRPPPRLLARPAAPRPAIASTAPVLPLPASLRRNLLFHVWPVRGDTWRWNIHELKRRIDLFNGRRVIGIVCDARSEPAQAVQDCLAGHGCEFVIAPNDARGEVVTFAQMLARVASTDADALSYYAHAKGVKYEPAFPPAVRRWAEVQYKVTLDDWPGVREQMQRHALTGIFRKYGRFRNHQNVGDWHYSGTFFWMRHAQVFTRAWQDVPQFYGGVEAWPGMQFRREEAGCMLLDNLQELPYQDRFWALRGDPAFRQWQATVRRVPVPVGLATPRPFDGHVLPRLEQKPEEFDWWIGHLLRREVHSLLFIGGGWGGEEWHVARRFDQAGRRINITTLCAAERQDHQLAVDEARQRFGQALSVVQGDVSQPGIGARLAERYDAVFIDGQHGYRECRLDFEFALRLSPQLVGLHDIVDSDWHAQNLCCVSRLWSELREKYQCEQMASEEWAGIGIVDQPGALR